MFSKKESFQMGDGSWKFTAEKIRENRWKTELRNPSGYKDKEELTDSELFASIDRMMLERKFKLQEGHLPVRPEPPKEPDPIFRCCMECEDLECIGAGSGRFCFCDRCCTPCFLERNSYFPCTVCSDVLVIRFHNSQVALAECLLGVRPPKVIYEATKVELRGVS